jgi:hypothetical protein
LVIPGVPTYLSYNNLTNNQKRQQQKINQELKPKVLPPQKKNQKSKIKIIRNRVNSTYSKFAISSQTHFTLKISSLDTQIDTESIAVTQSTQRKYFSGNWLS